SPTRFLRPACRIMCTRGFRRETRRRRVFRNAMPESRRSLSTEDCEASAGVSATAAPVMTASRRSRVCLDSSRPRAQPDTAKPRRASEAKTSSAAMPSIIGWPRSVEVLENLRIDLVARGLQAFREPGTDSRGGEPADDAAVLVHAVAGEGEEVLERDHVALHPCHLGDPHDFARPVAHTRGLHDQIDGGADLLAHGPARKLEATHLHHHLEAVDGI